SGMDYAQPVAKGIDTRPPVSRAAKFSVLCFCLGSLSIVLLDAIKWLRPSWEVNGVTVYLPSGSILPLVMLSAAALIMLFCRISPAAVTQGKAFTAGIQGMFSLLGIAWLSSTFVEGNQSILLEGMANHLSAPWQFAIVLLLMSAIMGSSAATVKAIFPLGIALGIAPKVLLASVAAVNGVFIIPIYPTILSAMNLDTTGTTRIGKYFFNHSFMLPGLITIIGAVGIAFLLIHFFF
ncbi:MAG: C4-dicarboxylate ABC transporter, partial [Amoebophilaceae bacterium]|nr:C4-dicarboxylate ABC transporter [Amoebophilaceae bacterium]